MTSRRVLRPTVGACTAIALVMVGGAAGRSLAAPREIAPVVVVTATIAQPLHARLAASEIDFEPAASRDVPLGVTADTIYSDLAAYLDVVASSIDPQSAAVEIAPRYGLVAGPDRCVAGIIDGCPSGARATVRRTLPEVRIQSARIGYDTGCASGAGPGVTLETNQPVAATVDVWAGEVDTWRVEGETDVAEREAWGLVQSAGAGGGPMPVHTCIPLPALADGAGIHVAHVEVVGVDGSRAFRRLALDPSGAPVRPSAVVIAPTPDLVAVIVPHREDETVVVSPNVLNGDDDPACDPVVAGYDLFIHPLLTTTSTVSEADLAAGDLDPAYPRRTSVAFDVAEGITVGLCIDVRSAATDDVQYHAEVIVETADRLQPSVSVDSIAGVLWPDWTLRGYLASGQHCGTFRVPGIAHYAQVEQQFSPSRPLCDTTTVLGSGASADSAGRGVLPLSFGNRGTFTVELAYGQGSATRTVLDLGRPAECTGTCVLPPNTFYPVAGPRGSAVVRVVWSQGNRNGASRTSVAPVEDNIRPRQPGAQLDVATAIVRQTAFSASARSTQILVRFRADEGASYVARLIGVDGSEPCTRPDAITQLTGILPAEMAEKWTGYAAVTFDGLCVGAQYQAVIELTDASGRTTVWGPPGTPVPWGAFSRVEVRPITVPLEVAYRLTSVAGSDPGKAIFLTLREGEQTLVGPHAGGCLGDQPILFGEEQSLAVRLGENIRLSGSVQTSPAELVFRQGCQVDWPSSPLALTFSVDLTLQQLLDAADGIVIRVDPPAGGDLPGGGTSAIIRIVVAS